MARASGRKAPDVAKTAVPARSRLIPIPRPGCRRRGGKKVCFPPIATHTARSAVTASRRLPPSPAQRCTDGVQGTNTPALPRLRGKPIPLSCQAASASVAAERSNANRRVPEKGLVRGSPPAGAEPKHTWNLAPGVRGEQPAEPGRPRADASRGQTTRFPMELPGRPGGRPRPCSANVGRRVQAARPSCRRVGTERQLRRARCA